MTKKKWMEDATAIKVDINGEAHVVSPKQFSTGSVGWMLSGKTTIDGNRVQMSCSFVIVGSKEWPSGDPGPEPPPTEQ